MLIESCLVVLLQTDPASVPQLAWQFVSAQKAVNPILAFCRGDHVHFLLVRYKISGYWILKINSVSFYFSHRIVLIFIVKKIWQLWNGMTLFDYKMLWFPASGKKRWVRNHPRHQTAAATSELWCHQPERKFQPSPSTQSQSMATQTRQLHNAISPPQLAPCYSLLNLHSECPNLITSTTNNCFYMDSHLSSLILSYLICRFSQDVFFFVGCAVLDLGLSDSLVF